MTARRALLALGLMGLLSTCSEPTSTGGGFGFGSVAIRVAAPPELLLFAPGLVIEQVKASIGRFIPASESFEVLDSTTVPFDVSRNTVNATLRVFVTEPETLQVEILYQTAGATTLFLASDQVVVRPGATGTSPVLQPFYIGPGSNIAFMGLSPFDSVLSAGDALTFDPSPFDANQQPVTQFYVSWATDDPRVPIDARGRIVAPDLTKLVNVTATTPNGVVATTTVGILGSAALGISPDSVEKLPNGTQLFRVTVGALRTSQFVWSVNGVDGGSAEFGTISVDGFYTAPATVPTPSRFQVCARDAAAPTLRQGCATVVISPVPSVGADVIVINDQNIFDSIPMSREVSPGNARFVRNLVNFSGTGPRASGTVVWYDRGRNSPCFLNLECADGEKFRLDSVITAAGYSIVKFDSYTRITTIPANVKLIVLWMPLIAYDVTEINTLKRFAGEGGRILFLGEWLAFYTDAGLAVENQFLADMGAQMINIGAESDCNAYFATPSASLRSHPLLQGVTSLSYACASEIEPGPNDFPLFYDTTNLHVLAGVAKIDLTPISNPILVRSAQASLAAPIAPAPPGLGRGVRR